MQTGARRHIVILSSKLMSPEVRVVLKRPAHRAYVKYIVGTFMLERHAALQPGMHACMHASLLACLLPLPRLLNSLLPAPGSALIRQDLDRVSLGQATAAFVLAER